MKYTAVVFLMLGFCCYAGAKDMEIAWTGGYYFRQLDEGGDVNGPGSGVTVSRSLADNLWIEGEALYGWNRQAEFYDTETFSSKWSGTRVLIGIYKRWAYGRVTYFAGGGAGIRFMNETLESTRILPDENDVPRTFHDVYKNRDTNGTIAGKIGGLVNVTSRLSVRFEAELESAYFFIPNIGTNIGLAWRF